MKIMKGKTMSMSEYLAGMGWRQIGSQPNGHGRTKYWDHPDHQPDRHGAFTTTSAETHQKQADKHGCDCIRTTEAKR